MTSTTVTTSGSAGADLDAAISGHGLRMLFQPILDLHNAEVVGHEALARGPVGSLVEAPDAMFALARGTGRLTALDWACRCEAFRASLDVGAPAGWRLFVNAEPPALNTACPPELLGDWVRAHRELNVVVEVTERCLMQRPADLVRVVATLRELGWEIALDDTGANDASVALLPVLQPDIVKLDRPLLAAVLSRRERDMLAAVVTYVERSGARLLAEGIETEHELSRAVDLGAIWGQGYLLGRPAPLAHDPACRTTPVAARRPAAASWELQADPTPFELLARAAPTLLTTQDALRAELAAICRDAAAAPQAAVLLLCLSSASPLPATLFDDLAALQRTCALVVVLAESLPVAAPAGLRLSTLPAGVAWSHQTTAIFLGPSSSRAVSALPTDDGRYEVTISADASSVAAASRVLLARTAPIG